MLGIDQLLPEIFLGVGLAVAIGSAIALVRRGGAALPKNPSERPRSLPPELRSVELAEGRAKLRAPEKAEENDSPPPPGVKLYTLRTVFFFLVGLVTALWGFVTILARG